MYQWLTKMEGKKYTYRSRAMATRCRMDAVQHSTSEAVHMSQSSGPSVHWRLTSQTAPRGMTRQATSRSATARDRIKQLATFCRWRSSRIAAITNTLPAINQRQASLGNVPHNTSRLCVDGYFRVDQIFGTEGKGENMISYMNNSGGRNSKPRYGQHINKK